MPPAPFDAVDEWLTDTSRLQYALVQGAVFFATMFGVYFLFTDYDLVSALILGTVGGVSFGGLQYAWDPRRS